MRRPVRSSGRWVAPAPGRRQFFDARTSAGAWFTWHEVNAAHALLRDEGERYDPAAAPASPGGPPCSAGPPRESGRAGVAPPAAYNDAIGRFVPVPPLP